MAKINCMLTIMIVSIFKLYQFMISPLLGNRCRFYPSCSQYTIESIRSHGILSGIYYSILRILKCHPFCMGGYDPIPERKQKC